MYFSSNLSLTKQNQPRIIQLDDLRNSENNELVDDEPPDSSDSIWIYQPPINYDPGSYQLSDFQFNENPIPKLEKFDSHKSLKEKILDMFKFMPERNGITHVQKKNKCALADFNQEGFSPWESYTDAA